MSIMFFQKVSAALKQARASWKSQPISNPRPGDWMEEGLGYSEDAKGMMNMAPSGTMHPSDARIDFDPEQFTRTEFAFNEKDSKGVPWLMRQVESGDAEIARAFLFEAKVNGAGKMLKEVAGRKVPYKIKKVFGTESFKAQILRSNIAWNKLRESNGARASLKEDWSDDWSGGGYDPNQYTEYAPLMGGYFFAQMYLTDMLKQMAYAFEAWNHNPLAHRIINGLAQYTLGRRFDWQISKKAKDYDRKQRIWEQFAEEINLRQRLSKFWIREKLIFGEMFLNINTWQTLHPATIWEIVTDPSDINDVYYYYRSYPTQYQMYSGMAVKGAPGSAGVPASRYVIEQIPYKQLLHMKSQCTSFEKRGRSTLFPILGWLKRVKDLYQAQITRAQMQAEYAWDVTIKGSQSDVTNFQTSNACIPRGNGNTFVHNEAVTREAMAVAPTGGRGGDAVVDNVLCFIATAIGLPKDFFNVISEGGGNRATALVAAEPFTKVIEDEQADWEFMLHKIFDEKMRQNGLETKPDDIEFMFPSVTKDTTSEAIKNVQVGYSEGLISKERAGELYAKEMSISAYNYEDEQQAIKDEQAKGDNLLVGGPPAPAGRFGDDSGGTTGDGSIGDAPNHGAGKVKLKKDLNNI